MDKMFKIKDYLMSEDNRLIGYRFMNSEGWYVDLELAVCSAMDFYYNDTAKYGTDPEITLKIGTPEGAGIQTIKWCDDWKLMLTADEYELINNNCLVSRDIKTESGATKMFHPLDEEQYSQERLQGYADALTSHLGDVGYIDTTDFYIRDVSKSVYDKQHNRFVFTATVYSDIEDSRKLDKLLKKALYNSPELDVSIIVSGGANGIYTFGIYRKGVYYKRNNKFFTYYGGK